VQVLNQKIMKSLAANLPSSISPINHTVRGYPLRFPTDPAWPHTGAIKRRRPRSVNRVPRASNENQGIPKTKPKKAREKKVSDLQENFQRSATWLVFHWDQVRDFVVIRRISYRDQHGSCAKTEGGVLAKKKAAAVCDAEH
jgi:hypothetical protein